MRSPNAWKKPVAFRRCARANVPEKETPGNVEGVSARILYRVERISLFVAPVNLQRHSSSPASIWSARKSFEESPHKNVVNRRHVAEVRSPQEPVTEFAIARTFSRKIIMDVARRTHVETGAPVVVSLANAVRSRANVPLP